MMSLAELGAALRTAGVTPRALAAWAGTDRLSALPACLPRDASTPAAARLALLVAGADVPVERVRGLDIAALAEHGLVEIGTTTARATVAILPLGESLLVCDRRDAPLERDLVCWPDDSSYHLARALPGDGVRLWIDLGCGSAVAPLLRPRLAASIIATDLNERAIRYARLGAALSGVRHLYTFAGDLGDSLPPRARFADLVTCNAPIPQAGEDPYRPIWRDAGTDFVARLYARAREMVLPDGLVVVHAALDALAPVVAELPGDRVVISYTPPGVRAFAVAWWRPDGNPRHITSHRDLTADHPHLAHADYAAIAT